MVSRINTTKSIRNALRYNEKKVCAGKAELLLAHYFIKDLERLSFYDKLRSFEKLTSLNERTTTNTLHLSLNFSPSERLDNQKMIAIATAYMGRIGFGKQPYLVYRHFDTFHPHVHIVTTNITKEGTRIHVAFMGPNDADAARREIELQFGLLRAQDKIVVENRRATTLSAQKIKAGKQPASVAIENVLGVVIPNYKYGSLAEFNAVLHLYHVTAQRCQQGSETYRHKGLYYRIIDEQGKLTGKPIKASYFCMKPTLSYLEARFAENEQLKIPHEQRLKTTIDFTLRKKASMTLEELTELLGKEQVSVVGHHNQDGYLRGITYVDHKTKCVFEDSSLGEAFTAAKILKRSKQLPLPRLGKKRQLNAARETAFGNAQLVTAALRPERPATGVMKSGVLCDRPPETVRQQKTGKDIIKLNTPHAHR